MTRAQKIAAFLDQRRAKGEKNGGDGDLRHRLPAMLQRHGLLQTLAYLDAKVLDGKKEAVRYRDARATLAGAMAQVDPSIGELEYGVVARAPVARYAFIHELALECATWMRLLS